MSVSDWTERTAAADQTHWAAPELSVLAENMPEFRVGDRVTVTGDGEYEIVAVEPLRCKRVS